MTDVSHDDRHDNPASTALHRVGSAGDGSWFGIAALVAAAISAVAGVVRLVGDSNGYGGGDFSTADRIAIFGSQITNVGALLALAALLVDGPKGRRLAQFALVAWAVAILLVAIAEQRNLGDMGM